MTIAGQLRWAAVEVAGRPMVTDDEARQQEQLLLRCSCPPRPAVGGEMTIASDAPSTVSRSRPVPQECWHMVGTG